MGKNEFTNIWFKHPVQLRRIPQIVELLDNGTKGKALICYFYIILELFFDRIIEKNSASLSIHASQLRKELNVSASNLDKILQKLEAFQLIFYSKTQKLCHLRVHKHIESLIFGSIEERRLMESNIIKKTTDKSISNSSKVFSTPPKKGTLCVNIDDSKIPEKWDDSYLERYSLDFLNKNWHGPREYYLNNPMKKPFKVFMEGRLNDSLNKYGDADKEHELALKENDRAFDKLFAD